ncbi:MAG: DUF1016 N-terminal domain-containing protein [Treponema sp.]|jgi:predicted nuclease of restriction endonuclease-like (RecB) superfamily|nr:DUF1016 N-terminal domain-containing protein [Treponema sp.]
MNLEKSQIDFITEIKQKIRRAQYDALKTVNVQLINLYWDIGKSVAEKQGESWGKAIVPTLSRELQKEFPGIGGFSERNLWLMIQFYNEYNGVKNLQPLVAEISWTKHIVILGKCKDNLERQFYIMTAAKFGWNDAITRDGNFTDDDIIQDVTQNWSCYDRPQSKRKNLLTSQAMEQ